MAVILNIETATNVCSIAVSSKGKVLFEKEEVEGPSHAQLLGVFVEEAVCFLQDNHLKASAVSVSCGPGSYTGLRIGVSQAKGLCYGWDVPLIAVDTPLILASKILQTIDNIPESFFLCPMIDARRMEVYAAVYDVDLQEIRPIGADIVDTNTYASFLKDAKVLFFGNGSEKCRDIIEDDNAVFISNVYPSASAMAQLAELYYDHKKFVNTAYFEPFYLKDFVATVPKKNILS